MPFPGVDDVPEEIWRLIALELVETTESKTFPTPLISVNRPFFNFHLDLKYGEVHWTKLDKRTVRQLQRLQSPVIANHVKQLRLHAWFIDSLMAEDTPKKRSRTMVPLRKWMKNMFKLSSTPKILSHDLESAEHFDQSFVRNGVVAQDRKRLYMKSILNAMISAIKIMPNVVYYNFELRDLLLTKDTELFLLTARRSFTSSLRKLSLHTTIPKFQSVLQLTDFEHLDELELHFDYQGANQNEQLMETIVPFINSRRENLRTLAVSSSCSADLSPFFAAIGPFPSLRRLALHIFFDEPHLSDHQTFYDFLHANKATLFNVEFKPRTPENQPYKDKNTLLAIRRDTWKPVHMKLVQSPDLLRNLESLMIPLVTLDDTLPLVRRSLQSLNRLSLLDRKLILGELKTVLQSLSERSFQLEHLHIEVKEITVGHIRALATHLPRLQSLILVYDQIDMPSFQQEMQLFKFMPVDWELLHLSVFEERCVELPQAAGSSIVVESSTTSSWREYDIMRIISQAFGTIKTFKGRRVR